MHTHSSILNIYLCTHYIQQHCCKCLIHSCIHIPWYIIPGNTYVEYIYLYAGIRMCTRITRTYQPCSRFCLFRSNPATVGSGSRKTFLKKTEYRLDEKICHDYVRRDHCTMIHWTKTRGTPERNPSTHESLSCANKRTTTAASSRRKQYQSVVPLHYMYDYHTAAAVVVST